MQLPKIGDDVFVTLWLPETEPEISVLMPLYNQEDYVKAAISSVLSQKGIVAEIIASDDGSKDGTFERALDVISRRLATSGCNHKIVVRRGKRRLWRDHLPLLVDNSNCDLVCQAHGDDMSITTRCRTLTSAFKADPLISLVVSGNPESFNGLARDRKTSANANDCPQGLHQFSYSEILDGHETITGSSSAWRKSAVICFQRLDTNFSPTAHDRILAFRAALTGKVMFLQAPLVKRRVHPLQASRWLVYDPDKNHEFGGSLLRINTLFSMKRDLHNAADQGLIAEEKKGMLEEEINKRLEVFGQRLIESFRFYTNSGKHIVWVDDYPPEKRHVTFLDKLKLYIPLIIVKTLNKVTAIRRRQPVKT